MDVPAVVATPSGGLNWKIVAGCAAAGIGAGIAAYFIINSSYTTRPWTGRARMNVNNANIQSNVEKYAALNPGHGWKELANKPADAHMGLIYPVDTTPLTPTAGLRGNGENDADFQEHAIIQLRSWMVAAGFSALDVRCAYCLFILECGYSGNGCHGFNLFNYNCGSVVYATPELILQRKIWMGIPESDGIFLLTDRVNHFKPYSHFPDFVKSFAYIHRVFSRSYPNTIEGWRQGGLEGLLVAEQELAAPKGDPDNAWSGSGPRTREINARAYWARAKRVFPATWEDRARWNP